MTKTVKDAKSGRFVPKADAVKRPDQTVVQARKTLTAERVGTIMRRASDDVGEHVSADMVRAVIKAYKKVMR
jgi:hypothetical protein